jgi:hypothetical protein
MSCKKITFIIVLLLAVINPFSLALAQTDKYPMLYPICEKGKWGYIDKTGKVVVPMKFASAEQFSEGMGRFTMAVPKTKKGLRYGCGFVDASGNIAVKPIYNDAGDFHDGVARVTVGILDDNCKSGFVDKKGAYVIPLVIRAGPRALPWGITDFSEGLACNLDFSGNPPFIDKHCNKIGLSNIRYGGHDYEVDIEGFKEGYAIVTDYMSGKNLYGYIDKKWNVFIAPQYDSASQFHDGLARVAKNGNNGYIDTAGNAVIELKYDNASDFSEGFASVQMNGEWHVIDTKGNVVIKQGFKQALTFSEGLAPIQVNKKWGYINTKGEVVIKSQYTSADKFMGGVAKVNCEYTKNQTTWDYINSKGQFIWNGKK